MATTNDPVANRLTSKIGQQMEVRAQALVALILHHPEQVGDPVLLMTSALLDAYMDGIDLALERLERISGHPTDDRHL